MRRAGHSRPHRPPRTLRAVLLKMSTRWPDERENVLVAAGISRLLSPTRTKDSCHDTGLKPHSTQLAAALAAALLIVTGGVIPWRLVAQEPARPVVSKLPVGTPLQSAQVQNGSATTTSVIGQVQNGSGTTTSFLGSFGVSSSGTSSTSSSSGSSSSSGVLLPGKIYLRTSVEIKTRNGEPENGGHYRRRSQLGRMGTARCGRL